MYLTSVTLLMFRYLENLSLLKVLKRPGKIKNGKSKTLKCLILKSS